MKSLDAAQLSRMAHDTKSAFESGGCIVPGGHACGSATISSLGRTIVKRDSNNLGILNHKGLSDEALVRSFVETQDEGAFGEIVERHGDRIYRLALRITGNPGDAEDVLQEVLIILFQKLHTFQGEAKFSTWLYRVALNAIFIHLRAEAKYRNNLSLEDYAPYGQDGVLEGVEAKDWSGRPDEILLNKEAMEIIENAVNELPVYLFAPSAIFLTMEIIENAVNELPELYRIVFHLRDVEGLTNPEVARILGLSLLNVKSRIHRARLFLRDRLSDYFSANGKNNLYPYCLDLHLLCR
jgi:RNA polymerase sigma-70 factor (ECF subfamily)